MKYARSRYSTLFFLLVITWIPVSANEVRIVAAQFNHLHNDQWTISVTLKHQDSGWDHYADSWRVVDRTEAVLGTRVLHHPHINEQPFTRSLTNVAIPTPTQLLFIEARDNVHGWSKNRLQVDLREARNGKLTVTGATEK